MPRSKQRLAELYAQGLCRQCTQNLSCPGLLTCTSCLNDNKTRRIKRRLDGICMRCSESAATNHSLCISHIEINKIELKTKSATLKSEIINHYGGLCSCCGESIKSFLTIDHIEGGGTKHRATITDGKGGSGFYRWLKAHNFPSEYRVLCFNCNSGRWINGGICPHQVENTL